VYIKELVTVDFVICCIAFMWILTNLGHDAAGIRSFELRMI